jgi:hypothetical protein
LNLDRVTGYSDLRYFPTENILLRLGRKKFQNTVLSATLVAHAVPLTGSATRATSSPMGTGNVFACDTPTARDVDDPPSTSTEIKNTWNHTNSPPPLPLPIGILVAVKN